MRAEIISVGTELLLGDIVNTNAQFLAQELASLGYNVYYQTVVGDNAVRLRELIGEARERSDVLIFTGGLGPTEDDLTKEVVTEAFGDILVLDAEELVKMEHMFAKRGIPMTENNKKQVMLPRMGRKLINNHGTAPGAFLRQGNKYAILLPGPPSEMQPMFTEEVLPILESMQDSAMCSTVLRVFGLGESALEEQVYNLLSGTNPTAALYAKTGEVHIRITAKAATAEQAEIMCHEYADLFHTALGDIIYSANGDDLETVAVARLATTNSTVATAESCTGGLLGERLTGVPGASNVYGYGAITYANDAKHDMLGVRTRTLRKYGAVSSQVAAEMAFGATVRGQADYGIGITGIAGPDGGTAKKPVGLVYVAVCTRREVYIKKLELGNRGRAYVREIATHHALDMLRRLASGLPIPNAKSFTKAQLADYEREGRPRRRGSGLVRALIAVLAVALLVLLIVLGNYSARTPAPADEPAETDVLASMQGLRYGTEEYTNAAMELVRQTRAQNPAISGFIALPGERVESLVAQTANGQQAQLDEALGEVGTDGLPVLAADAVQTGEGANPVLLGEEQFAQLWEYRHATMADSLSTFTYFTAGEERVYKVLGVYLADGEDAPADEFDPAVRQVTGYSGFLSFLLGTKARSLYELNVDARQDDAYMTLAVQDPDNPSRHLYITGRRLRAGEDRDTPDAFAAGSPLMPTAWYAEQNTRRPDVDELYAWWLRWYLTRDTTNSQLQLSAGMPARDTAPSELVVRQSSTSSYAGLLPQVAEDSAKFEAPVALFTGTTGSDASDSSEADDDADEDQPGQAPEEDGQAVTTTPARPMPNPLPQKPDPATLTVTMNGQVTTDSTLTVLAQICQAEAGNLEPAAIKAVAICAHSWILNQQGAGNSAPAVSGSMPTERVLNAVMEVERLILSADDANPAFTPWFAVAANGTNTAFNVWGTERAYLAGASSPGDAGLAGWTKTVFVSLADFEALLLEKEEIDLADYGPQDSWVGEVTRSENGYVDSVEIGGQAVSGFDLWNRVLVQEGASLLPSPAFEVEFTGEGYNFICYGQGHGCGLSLAGAQSFAQQSWNYQSILENYFPGCELITW